MYPHQIRLLGPWTAADGRRVNLPVRLAELGPVPIRLARRFGAPRQLDDWERVRLIADEMNGAPAIWRLNGEKVVWIDSSAHLPRRADVTTLLQPRNELVAEWTGGDGSFAGAMLEIGCRACIAAVNQTGLDIVVEVVSESTDDPLELYAMIDGESQGYRGPFHAAGSMVHAFRLEEPPQATAKVDLVCRSVFWDSVELFVLPKHQ